MYGALVYMETAISETDKEKSWCRCPQCSARIGRWLAVQFKENEPETYCTHCGARIREYLERSQERLKKFRESRPDKFPKTIIRHEGI